MNRPRVPRVRESAAFSAGLSRPSGRCTDPRHRLGADCESAPGNPAGPNRGTGKPTASAGHDDDESDSLRGGRDGQAYPL